MACEETTQTKTLQSLKTEEDLVPTTHGLAKRSEKGLLTPDNCVVAFIDHQPQMLFGASYPDRQSIINNTVAFAKATRVFDVPVVLTTVETHSFSGDLWPYGAYGIGVEYAYTMVHKAPATVFPEYVIPSPTSHR